MGGTYDYGNWSAVVFSVFLFTFFALSFLAPWRRRREWRSFGVLTAFLVALFTEMFGFPLTIYLVTSVLGRSPFANPFQHESGHLWGSLIGDYYILFCTLGSLFIVGGLITMGMGWWKIHRAGSELVTDGIYGRVRHPQYMGLILLVVGFLVQWPTIITMLMAPILVGAYIWLARREEKELEERFGNEYRRYKDKTPAFLFLLRRSV